jgi:2-polyprenyl-3-methyl-5-hydroxy-6-metoxy-1,4-benzoquinol methylase
VKDSNIDSAIDSSSFAITDSSYGVTSELSQCRSCGFIQSTGVTEVLSYYESLEDSAYEENRKERLFQADKIVSVLSHYKKEGSLLDVGAGSGIFVESARLHGYDAVGIEPSAWLQNKAKEHRLPVVKGTFPHQECKGPYDIITIIDVIEHVDNPVGMLQDAYTSLKKDGVIVVITPDVNSLVARVLGYKWWHFRIAHIGYFNKKTLHKALITAGFVKVRAQSAKWYFSLDYLVARVNTYLPSFLKIPVLSFFSKITVPLNLFDSVYFIYKKP